VAAGCSTRHGCRSLLDLPTEFRWHEPVPNEAVTGITLDSRQVMSGDLYCALAGANVHGADYADQAIGAGAAVILTDQIGAARVRSTWPDFPLLVADNPRAMVGELASWVYGYPSESMKIIGITGTDGKTTTAMLAEAGLQAAGFSTGLIGTIATRIGNEEMPSVRTTPEAPELQALLAVMLERGVTAVVMEVSSHALALGRVSGIRFDLAIFTNLGHDHLDFHKSQEEYFSVKARLFTSEFSQAALVCVDDTWGKRLASTAEIPTQTYSVAMDGDGHTAESTPDWSVSGLTIESVGWRFVVAGPTGSAPGGCQLPGLFNVRNALARLPLFRVSGLRWNWRVAVLPPARECQGACRRLPLRQALQSWLTTRTHRTPSLAPSASGANWRSIVVGGLWRWSVAVVIVTRQSAR
jgi:UDP-N-acetylmuramoyl-L-alanyl-D-glutamate--2,6-diaminopimelate ligase